MSAQGSKGQRHLLLVEDDGYCLFFLKDILHLQSTEITTVERGSKVFETASLGDFHTIMVNLETLSQKDLSVVTALHEDNQLSPLIAVSERSDVDFALEALRAGAFDYLTKPFNNASRVEKALNNAFLKSDRLRETVDLIDTDLATHGMVGNSRLLKGILGTIQQIAPLNVNVLITGESGTGKELIARAIHAQSNRKKNSFFAVNCGALPEGLVESIFFGHEKGAFTGATQAHMGFMEKAESGTVLLDEVSELSPRGQVALLRFLENREFVRVGGTKTQTSDVRIVAATNRNLEHEVDQGNFREDLYYRLNVVQLTSPALRYRPEDIVPLAGYFLKRFCLKNDLKPLELSGQVASLLERYRWPGNVREVENLMERVAATIPSGRSVVSSEIILRYSEKIRKALTPARKIASEPLEEQTYREAFENFEKRYLTDLLKRHGGNVAKAARHAGIHPVTLHRKLKKFRLNEK